MSEPMPVPPDRWPTWIKIVIGAVVLCICLIVVMAVVGCQRPEPAPEPTPATNRRMTAQQALEDLTGGTHQKREVQQANLFTEGAVIIWLVNYRVLIVDGSDDRVMRLTDEDWEHIAGLYQ